MGLVVYLWVTARLWRIPGGNLIDLARMGGGVWGAVAVALAAGGELVFHCGMVVRETSEMAVSGLYPHTPQTFAMVLLLGCVAYAALGSTAGLVRLGSLLALPLVLSVVFILLGNAGWGSVQYLLPFWGPGPDAVALGGLRTLRHWANVVLAVLLLSGPVQDRERLMLWGAVGWTVGGPLVAAVVAQLLMAYPLPLGFQVNFPLFHLSRLLVGGRYFERTESLWVLFWFMGTAFHVALMVHATAVAWAGAFAFPSHRWAVPALVAVVATLALFPRDVVMTTAWHRLENGMVPVTFGLILLLAWLTVRRSRRQRHAA